MGFTIDDYYNPSWQIYHQWRRLYIASDATAKNLRALDFAQKKNKKIKIKNIPPYPFSKSKVLHWDYTRGTKDDWNDSYPYERESVSWR